MSDGLSAVYRFETRIGEGAQTTDEIYVGLGGGFGTVSLGKQPSAGNVHVGFVDQSLALGSNELLTGDQGSKISYASPSIGGFSFQADAQGNRSGHQDKDVDSAQLGATLQLGENAKIGMAYIDRDTKGMDNPVAKKDPGHYSASGALCENPGAEGCTYSAGKAADPKAHLDDDRTAMIAGHYTLGGIGAYLGYGEQKMDTNSKAAKWVNRSASGTESYGYGKGLDADDLLSEKKETTFFGFHGGIGDTGVNFFVQVRSNKTTETKVAGSYDDRLKKWIAGKYSSVADAVAAARNLDLDLNPGGDSIRASGAAAAAFTSIEGLDSATVSNPAKPTGIDPLTAGGSTAPTPAQAADAERKTAKSSEKTTPFTIGVSRSLGGGASIHLEHANQDDDMKKNQTALILKVDF